MTVSAGDGVFDTAVSDDPYPYYAELRDSAPVHRLPGTDFHLVTTWDLVQEAAVRVQDFSSHLTGILVVDSGGAASRFSMDLDGQVEQVLATADGDVHKAHRAVVLKALARRIRPLEEEVGRIAAGLWEAHAADGRVEWVGAMADRLPSATLARLIGLPDADVPQLVGWAYESTELLGGLADAARLDALLGSTVALHGYLRERLDDAMAAPREDDVLGALAQACIGDRLRPETAVLVLLQLVGAGAETTAGLIGTAARRLASDPALQDRLRADPGLVDPFLDECLRLESPLRGHYRVATRDTTLGGVPIPAGSHLLLLWSSANRDPARFTDPDVVDLDRESVRQHLAFGKGPHFCLGSPLARLEATAAVRLLLARTRSFAVDAERPPRWVRSLVVRRHERLDLVYVPADCPTADGSPAAASPG